MPGVRTFTFHLLRGTQFRPSHLPKTARRRSGNIGVQAQICLILGPLLRTTTPSVPELIPQRDTYRGPGPWELGSILASGSSAKPWKGQSNDTPRMHQAPSGWGAGGGGWASGQMSYWRTLALRLEDESSRVGPRRGVPGRGKDISKGLEGDIGGLVCQGWGNRWPCVNEPNPSTPLSSELSTVTLSGLKPVQCWCPGSPALDPGLWAYGTPGPILDPRFNHSVGMTFFTPQSDSSQPQRPFQGSE